MTGQADWGPFDAFKESVEEALEVLQCEIDRLARGAGSFDDNVSEIEVQCAWDNGKDCGYLEAVMELLDFQMSKPPTHCIWPPEAVEPPPTFQSERKHAAFLLSQAMNHCANDCDLDAIRMAMRLLNGDAKQTNTP